jgi:hypothetical protein
MHKWLYFGEVILLIDGKMHDLGATFDETQLTTTIC